MISTVINVLLTLLSFFLKNHKATNKNQVKVDKLVNENTHLLSEVTKQNIANGVNKVNEKVDNTIDAVDNADSLQQSNAAINKTLNNK